MNQVISQIILKNEKDILNKKQQTNFFEMQDKIAALEKPVNFLEGLKKGAEKNNGVSLITELKFASPSEKELGRETDLELRVQEYESAGADAVSIVTERYFFNGDLSFINRIKNTSQLPLLQKDFIVDPFQIYESRINGADALLLIAKLISADQLKKYVELCMEIGLEPVVEVNDELDLKDALHTKTRIIAVNARDLDTMYISIGRACEILTKIPSDFFKLGFSGINTGADVERYKQAGAQGVLVGTNLMKAENIGEFIKGLRR